MHIRKPLGERIFDWINILLLCLLVIVTLYPLLYVLFASISEPNQLVKYRGILWAPLGFSSASYEAVFLNPNIMTGYRNTLFYMVLGTTLNLFLTCLGAYGPHVDVHTCLDLVSLPRLVSTCWVC